MPGTSSVQGDHSGSRPRLTRSTRVDARTGPDRAWSRDEMSHDDLPYDERLALASLLRSVAIAVAIIVAYFVLPMTKLQTGDAGVLVSGIAVVALLLAW